MKRKLPSTIIGDAAKEIRIGFGLSQVEAARLLNITQVHLCNVENSVANPSPKLAEKYHLRFGVNLCVYAWVTRGDLSRMSAPIRKASERLAKVWRADLRSKGKDVLK